MDFDTRNKIRDALTAVADKPVDAGTTPDGADFWLVINGREYFLTARPSTRQRHRDSLNGSTMQ